MTAPEELIKLSLQPKLISALRMYSVIVPAMLTSACPTMPVKPVFPSITAPSHYLLFAARARIVDQNIGPAKGLFDFMQEARNVVGSAHVSLYADSGHAALFGNLGGLFLDAILVPGAQGQVNALLRQPFGNRQPDPDAA